MMLTCIATTPTPTIVSWRSRCYIGDIIEFPSNMDPSTTTTSTLNGSSTVAATYHGFRITSGSYVHNTTLLIQNPMDGPCSVICTTSEGQPNKTIIQVFGNKSCIM